MRKDLTSIVPHSREIGRKLGELFGLAKCSFVIHLVVTLLKHLLINSLDLDKFLVTLLHLICSQLSSSFFFPSVKHFNIIGTVVFDQIIIVIILRNLSRIYISQI